MRPSRPFLITVYPAFRVGGVTGMYPSLRPGHVAASSTAIDALFRVNFIASEPSAQVLIVGGSQSSWCEATQEPPLQWEYNLQPC